MRIFFSCLFIGDFSVKLFPWAKGFKASNMELISKILLKLEIKRIFQLLNGLESTRKSYFCAAGVVTVTCIVKRPFFIGSQNVLNAVQMETLFLYECLCLLLFLFRYLFFINWMRAELRCQNNQLFSNLLKQPMLLCLMLSL